MSLLKIQPSKLFAIPCWLVLSLLLLTACSQSTPTALVRSSQPFPRVEALEEIPCPFDLPYEGWQVTCGKLEVPEDYTNPNGDKVTLTVARVHSSGENPQPDPVIVMGSDPGFPDLQFLRYFIEAPVYSNLLEERDLVFYERRGATSANPNLVCPDYAAANYEVAGKILSRSSRIQAFAQAIQECHQKLVEEGVPLQFYTTDENVADLHALQLALGEEQVNLMGLGYGADLALRLAQLYPERIRSVLASSPYNLTDMVQDQAQKLNRALELMFERCAKNEECSQAYPNLKNDFFSLVDQLNSNPVTIDVTKMGSIETMPVVVNGDDFLSQARGMISYQNINGLPKLIEDVKAGRAYHLATQLEFPLQSVEFISIGAYQSVVCQAYVADQEFPQPPNQIPISLRQWQQYNLDYDQAVCDDWFAIPPAPLSGAGYTSNVPVLLLNGEFNAYVSPGEVENIAEALGSARFVEMKEWGWVDWSEPCAMQLGLAFLNDPSAGLDTSCVEEIPPVEFILPMK
jgi:pimeloyl-ACP methyl ester carboxylesterase